MSSNEEQPRNLEDLDPADHLPLASGNVAGTPDVTGQPGVETALGRDASQGELSPEMGYNRQTDPDTEAVTSMGSTGAGELGDTAGR
jgi:hypothetical protein